MSFITFDKAKSLRLVGKGVKLGLISIGGQSTMIDSVVYKLKLATLDDNTVEIEAYGIKKISSQVDEVSNQAIAKIFQMEPNQGVYNYRSLHDAQR